LEEDWRRLGAIWGVDCSKEGLGIGGTPPSRI
jgi:hypothetical protein